jgi:hypothetical protein
MKPIPNQKGVDVRVILQTLDSHIVTALVIRQVSSNQPRKINLRLGQVERRAVTTPLPKMIR